CGCVAESALLRRAAPAGGFKNLAPPADLRRNPGVQIAREITLPDWEAGADAEIRFLADRPMRPDRPAAVPVAVLKWCRTGWPAWHGWQRSGARGRYRHNRSTRGGGRRRSLERRVWRQDADTRERRLTGPNDGAARQCHRDGRLARRDRQRPRRLPGDLRGSGEKGRANEPVSNSAHDPPSLARVLPVQDRHSSWQTLTDMRVPRALRGSLR